MNKAKKKSEITIVDIASRANVSKSTVSRVLNNSTHVNDDKRDAVLAAMDELGYKPNVFARGLAGGQSMTIGIMTQNIGSPFYDSIAQGMINGLSGTGYTPIFVDGQWEQSTEMAVLNTLLDRRVDGLLLIGGTIPLEEMNTLREQIPTVVVARELEGWSGQCVLVDNLEAGYVATKHLIDFGHRNIAIFLGNKDHPDATDRYKGYVKALNEADIELNEDLVFQGDFSSQSGLLGVSSLLSRGINFTAIFAANDMVAFGARLALHRQGLRVPEDVSLVGFDDQAEAAYATPPLTSMRQPAIEMGKNASQALIDLIANKETPMKKMSAKLQIRESVARLN